MVPVNELLMFVKDFDFTVSDSLYSYMSFLYKISKIKSQQIKCAKICWQLEEKYVYTLGQSFLDFDVHTDCLGALLKSKTGLRPEVLHL